MPKKDVVVRTAADLERKYNFASFLGLKKNVEITNQGIQKIENELNNMLNALVINLKDVLDSQSDVSLWFYSGIPTTSNEPYVSWGNSEEHIGDIYYDQSSGYVYQWNGVWEVNTNPDLIEAMAITNSEIDTSTDHERKVYFDAPTIPYSNGDWWIKEDGSLFICQISKSSGIYEKDDFIESSNYTESIAEKIGEEIKVLKGTITLISENFAKFTDLATGGSTTIAGENITTGNIQSNNYIENVSGMKISLEDGTIDSKHFKTDAEGKVTATSGEIGGFSLGEDKFSADISTTYDFTLEDYNKVMDYLNNNGTLTEEEMLKYDVNGDGVIDKLDSLAILRMHYGYIESTISGTLEINSKETLRTLILKDAGGKIQTSVGLNGIQTPNLTVGGQPLAKTFTYSTSEEIVGTWIDGKPIYRKVYEYGSLVNGTIPTGYSADAITIIKAYGYARYNNLENKVTLPIPYSSPVLNENIKLAIVDGNIELTTGYDRSGATACVVLEYTKTTD